MVRSPQKTPAFFKNCPKTAISAPSIKLPRRFFIFVRITDPVLHGFFRSTLPLNSYLWFTLLLKLSYFFFRPSYPPPRASQCGELLSHGPFSRIIFLIIFIRNSYSKLSIGIHIWESIQLEKQKQFYLYSNSITNTACVIIM